MRLQICLLGRFEVKRDGVPVERWPRASTQRLLKLLAVEPRHAVRAEKIASLLWPNAGGSQIQQRLHHQIYLLRSALEATSERRSSKESCIRVRDGVISLATSDTIWIDADEFERTLDAALLDNDNPAQLEHALRLYQGALLPDDEADEWLGPHRTHLEQRYLNAAHVLAERHSARRDPESAVVVLQRLLRFAPADEKAHRELIGLLSRAGRTHEAQRQYAECKQALARELGVAPSEQTRLVLTTNKAAHAAAAPSSSLTLSRPEQPSPQPKRYSPPAPLVSLIGRDALVTEITCLLNRGDNRLTTLTGLGGVGKTQLALHVSNRHLDRYAHGVCFVSLADVHPTDLVEHICRELGISLEPESSAEAQLTEFLKDKHLLLTLDNFEHLLSGAALLPRLLERCAQLSILVTSRKRLNLIAERTLQVPPLDVESSVAASNSYETLPAAAQLFLQRARAAMPSLELNKDNLLDAIEIGRELDGLPLAIELAAARSVLYDTATLRQALSNRLAVVVGGGPDRPARHRSLRDSLFWSYALLSPAEQHVLQRLSLFAATFGPQAAIALCADLVDDVSIVLQGLVEAGFVARVEACTPHSTAARFQLLSAAREFARSKLDHDAQSAEAGRRFIDVYIELAQRLNLALDTAQANQALETLKLDQQNFFSALELAERLNKLHAVRRLVCGLCRYWAHSRLGQTADSWVLRAAALSDRCDEIERSALSAALSAYWQSRDKQRDWQQLPPETTLQQRRQFGY